MRAGRLMLPAALLLAALGLLAVAPAAGSELTLPPGGLILIGGAVAALVLRSRIGSGLGLVAVVLVGFASLDPGVGDELSGARGTGPAVARWVQVVGLGIALAVAAYQLAPRRLPAIRSIPVIRAARGGRDGGGETRRDWLRPVQIACLLALCAIGAELLAAYSDNTGNPGGIAFALVFFSALYGAPALLARELVRRCGWRWPSLLLLFAALGVAQACLIDQSMFSTDYQGYEDWEQTREATLIPALGISAFNAYNFVLGHVIFSFAAPVALAESWRPERAREPWLGLVGVLIAVLAYVGAAALIVADPESHSGSVPQLVISAGLVIAFAMAAVAVGRRNPVMRGAVEPPSGRRLPVWAVLAGAFVAALIAGVAGDDWTGLVVSVAITALLGVVVLRASRQSWWTCRHTAAVGLAFLLVRGLLAFTYFPLIGEVAAGPKYAHNVAMLLIVLLAGWFSLRAPSDRPGFRPMSTRRQGRADRSSRS